MCGFDAEKVERSRPESMPVFERSEKWDGDDASGGRRWRVAAALVAFLPFLALLADFFAARLELLPPRSSSSEKGQEDKLSSSEEVDELPRLVLPPFLLFLFL